MPESSPDSAASADPRLEQAQQAFDRGDHAAVRELLAPLAAGQGESAQAARALLHKVSMDPVAAGILGACLLALLVIAALYMGGCGGAQRPADPAPPPVSATDLYPMQQGWAWSYDAVARDGVSILAISRVLQRTGEMAEVSTGAEVTRYQVRPDGVFRLDRGAYLLRDPIEPGAQWSSGSGMTATVEAMDVSLQTPAGALERCVRVVESGSPSGLVVSTVYCPGVGPARVSATIQVRGQTLQETATLRGYAGPGAAQQSE